MRKLSITGIKNARIVPEDSILITSIASIGKNALTLRKVSFNQQINALVPSDDNEPYFLLSESEIWSNKMENLASSGTLKIVNKKTLSNLTTFVPQKKEQSKIGLIFKDLDKSIAANARDQKRAFKISNAQSIRLFKPD
ncbi:hypothetical protein FC87_GL000340 [Fructilactobacillus florum DSM 22689 = JCM 16035]|uniref:Type I restriction modification DNA specificity domain-containing protein n=1 Tax=Fructilactobacillus florum DSM 22689 = JCM 16035 TaxID=1423745 RepID=A0A0R2CDH3_9LACO|nr:hypothetical protein FC87_GL000340 [Fructilactobacillus florum DSM 22689 = JCM 16035]